MLLLHTADWQLGLKAGQVGDRAADLRERRFDAAERIVELAHERGVDLVLIAGDTFDHPDVDERIVARAVEVLAATRPIPVAILPGNHDPLVSGGLWRRASWRRVGDHVRLLDEPTETEILPGVALYPCPLTQKRSRRDPTAWIPTRGAGDERLRIGVAHGSLTSLGVAENFPIAVDRAERTGLDYLALGDWHGLFVADERSAYAGTPETTSFSERDPGHVLLVRFDDEDTAPGRRPDLEAVKVGRLHWHVLDAELRDPSDLVALEERLEALGERESLLLRLSMLLRRSAAPELYDGAEALRLELAERCFFSEVTLEIEENNGADPPPGLDRPGLLRRVDEALTALIDGQQLHGLPMPTEEVDVATARRARQLLHRLVRREASEGAAAGEPRS